jgi:hypothetical protein
LDLSALYRIRHYLLQRAQRLLSAARRLFPASRINYLTPLHQDFINSATRLRVRAPRKATTHVAAAATPQFD